MKIHCTDGLCQLFSCLFSCIIVFLSYINIYTFFYYYMKLFEYNTRAIFLAVKLEYTEKHMLCTLFDLSLQYYNKRSRKLPHFRRLIIPIDVTTKTSRSQSCVHYAIIWYVGTFAVTAKAKCNSPAKFYLTNRKQPYRVLKNHTVVGLLYYIYFKWEYPRFCAVNRKSFKRVLWNFRHTKTRTTNTNRSIRVLNLGRHGLIRTDWFENIL